FRAKWKLVSGRWIPLFIIWHGGFLIRRLCDCKSVQFRRSLFTYGPHNAIVNQLEESRISERPLIMAKSGIENPALAVFFYPGIGFTPHTVNPLHQYDDVVCLLIVYICLIPLGCKRFYS